MQAEKTVKKRKRRVVRKRSVVDSCQIEDAVKNESVSPISISKTDFGAKYKYRIPVKGANGQIKNVIAVYQIDNGSQIPRMITNYVERKR